MKFILSLTILMFSLGASAGETTADNYSTNSLTELIYPGKGRKKGSRREKRTNKKRKRKCHQFGRRGFAG